MQNVNPKIAAEYNPHQIETILEEEVIDEICELILWNDDVNTFDWVIKSLIDICKIDDIQAEQCAYFIHYKGKFAVKKATFNELKPMCEAFIDRGINATIS